MNYTGMHVVGISVGAIMEGINPHFYYAGAEEFIEALVEGKVRGEIQRFAERESLVNLWIKAPAAR